MVRVRCGCRRWNLNRIFAALLVLWGILTGGLAVLSYAEWTLNLELHEKNESLTRLDASVTRACEDVHRVNLLYERQLNRMMDQLGLTDSVAKRKLPESAAKVALGGPSGENDANGTCEARGEVR